MADAQPEDRAQRAADALAFALEEAGFDVGRAFPGLRSLVDHMGLPIVDLGRVTDEIAAQLAVILVEAARRGVTVPEK